MALAVGCPPCEQGCGLRRICASMAVACSGYADWVSSGGSKKPTTLPNPTRRIYLKVFPTSNLELLPTI